MYKTYVRLAVFHHQRELGTADETWDSAPRSPELGQVIQIHCDQVLARQEQTEEGEILERALPHM